MANLIDLLSSYEKTVQCNNNISRLYIIYQAFMLFGSLLSPATIILMVVTAMETTMRDWFSLLGSVLINLILIGMYIAVCLYFESMPASESEADKKKANANDRLKIKFAVVLSVLYAFLMLAVLAGTGESWF